MLLLYMYIQVGENECDFNYIPCFTDNLFKWQLKITALGLKSNSIFWWSAKFGKYSHAFPHTKAMAQGMCHSIFMLVYRT